MKKVCPDFYANAIIVKKTYTQGARVNDGTRNTDKDNEEEQGMTPLYYASRQGHVDIARRLLEHAADPNQTTSSDGTTPLMMAADHHHASVINLLLEFKATIDQKDTNGYTALMIAAYHGM